MKPKKIKHKDVITWTGYDSSSVGKIEDLTAVRTHDGNIWSCWQPSFKEKIALLFGGNIWLSVLADRLPPVCVMIHRGEFFKDVKGETDEIET